MRWLAATLAGLALSCKPDFERMLVQPKVNPSADDPLRLALLAPGHPIEGTVAHDAVLDRPQWTSGCVAGAYVAHVPVEVTAELLHLGRLRFATFCAACHGSRGDGISPVAQAMETRKPKSLLSPPVRDYPPGRIYRTIANGYRLMPSYRDELDVRERWAVTAYVESLQGSAGPGLGAVPVDAGDPGPRCDEVSP